MGWYMHLHLVMLGQINVINRRFQVFLDSLFRLFRYKKALAGLERKGMQIFEDVLAAAALNLAPIRYLLPLGFINTLSRT